MQKVQTIDITAPEKFNTRTILFLLDNWNLIDSDFYISKKNDGRRVQGRSLLGLLSLCINRGDIIRIHFFNDKEDALSKDVQIFIDGVEMLKRR